MIYFMLGKRVTQHMCGYQKTTHRNLFCPSTMWILGIKSKSSGLTASTFTG